MAYFRCGGGGIPSSLKTDMNAVYNKKFGTSTTYDPSVWASTANLLGPLPEKTASGAVASITDGADAVPIKAWDVTIAPTLVGVSSVRCQAEDGDSTSILDTTVSLGRTIYGGSVDVVAGTGTDGYGKLILSDLDGWVRKSNQNPNGTVFAIDAEMTGYSWDTANSICNYLTPCPADKQNFNTAPADTFWFSTTGYLRVCTGLPNTGTTKEQFLQWAENNGVFIVSPLATGTDFTFTPITPTPETPLGASNFWADEGDSDVTYRADIDLLLGGN